MNQNIDYISYTGTETSPAGDIIVSGTYFIPFLDYFFIYTALIFTLGLSCLVIFLLKRK